MDNLLVDNLQTDGLYIFRSFLFETDDDTVLGGFVVCCCCV